MNDILDKLNSRILDISIKHNLSHLGSCLTTLPIIYEIFMAKNKEDSFVLSNGHAGLAYYVIIEHFYNIDAEFLLEKYGIHPERDIANMIEVSTGSLGLGITIACGMALANKEKKVYCIISDGEIYEGSVWEALRFIDEYGLDNIEIYVNINGWSAYKSIDTEKLKKQLISILPRINLRFTNVNDILEFETELSAHYKIANELMVIKKIT